MNVRLVGLEERRFGNHEDVLDHRAEFHLEIDAGDLSDGDVHVGPRDIPESRQRHLDVVGTRQHVDHAVGALVVGDRFPCEIRVLVDDRDRGARDERATAVTNDADHGAVQNLGFHGHGREANGQGNTGGDRNPPT